VFNSGAFDLESYVGQKGGGNNPYIENAICDASANPYYAVMLALAGIVQGLDVHAGKAMPIASIYKPVDPLPTHAALKEHCLRTHGLRDILNRCSPALGDQLMDAVANSTLQQQPEYKGKIR